jgi:hypothetical protein
MSDRKLRVAFPSGQIVLILMGVLVLYLAVDFGRQVILSHQRHDELRAIQSQISASAEHQADLQKRLEYGQSDAAAEAWARSQGWVKANEVPVVLVAPAGTGSSETQGNGSGGSASDSVPDKWWDLFFGNR